LRNKEKGEKEMSAKEAVKPLQEYANVPLAELVESSTNPRKTFDEEGLGELAESIRSKGVLSPLLARRVNGHFEIVSGAWRYRAAKRAGLQEKARTLYKKADAATLTVLIFEAMLISSVGNATPTKEDDPLTDAVTLYKVDVRKLRSALRDDARKAITRKGRKAKTKG
jgi:hypothetical protein